MIHHRSFITTVCPALVLGGLTAVACAVDPEWTIYRPTNTGILGDYVQTIFVDEADQPWIAAYTPFWEAGGMSHFNGDTWHEISSDDLPIITSPRFYDIIKDGSGIMWIATPTGLLKYNPAVGPSSLVRYDQGTSPIPTSSMRDLALAPDGSIWVAMWHTPTGAGGLGRFQPATASWQVWTSSTGLPWGTQWPGWNAIDNVAVTNDLGGGYTVWFESNALGVATYKNGVFNWFGVPSDVIGMPGIIPYAIESNGPADAAGNIWLLTNQGRARRNPNGTYTMVGGIPGFISAVSGVFAMSGGRAVATSFAGDVAKWDGGWQDLGDWGNGNHTYAFAEESDGSSFWVGGIGGAARYHNGVFQRYRKTNTGMLSFFMDAIEFAPDGRVFFNANAGPGVGGFDIFDGERWTCVNDYNYGLGPVWGLPADNVSTLCWRSNGRLAHAPGGQGIYEWDGVQHHHIVPQGYDLDQVVEDSLGRLWASGSTGGGLLVTGGTFVQIGATVPLIYGWIHDIAVDPVNDGWVWMATALALLHTNGAETDVFPREQFGLTSGVIFVSVAAHQDGTVWFGAAGSGDAAGLHHLDPRTGAFTVYLPGAAPLPSDDIRSIEIAPDGTVWAASFDETFPYPGGLTHFDGSTWTTYTRENSPLLHNQTTTMKSRPVPGGYELWVGSCCEGVAVISVAVASPADLNGDGLVNGLDLAMLLAAWGRCPAPPAGCPADLDASGGVNGLDLAQLLAAWGPA
jgi:Dockerin type I domain